MSTSIIAMAAAAENPCSVRAIVQIQKRTHCLHSRLRARVLPCPRGVPNGVDDVDEQRAKPARLVLSDKTSNWFYLASLALRTLSRPLSVSRCLSVLLLSCLVALTQVPQRACSRTAAARQGKLIHVHIPGLHRFCFTPADNCLALATYGSNPPGSFLAGG